MINCAQPQLQFLIYFINQYNIFITQKFSSRIKVYLEILDYLFKKKKNRIPKFCKIILNQKPKIFWACNNKYIKI